MTDIPADFLNVLVPHLPFAAPGEIGPADRLTDLGLDSMGVVTLMTDLEDAYAVVLPDEFLTETTFESVGSLWQALVDVLTFGTAQSA